MSTKEVIQGLAVAEDPHFREAVSYLTARGFDLRVEGAAARSWCLSEAAKGNPQAQYVSAELWMSGLFGGQDLVKAVELCQHAARAGYPPALLLLSSFYESGFSTFAPDARVARDLLQRAASAHYLPAMRTLGIRLYETQASRDEGRILLEEAASQGDLRSKTFLSLRRLEAHQTEQEQMAALQQLTAVARLGDPHANRMLGYFHKGGEYGLARSDQIAESYFAKADELEKSSWKNLVADAMDDE
jgi:TPR repeat protein